jgi:hypothetical protein
MDYLVLRYEHLDEKDRDFELSQTQDLPEEKVNTDVLNLRAGGGVRKLHILQFLHVLPMTSIVLLQTNAGSPVARARCLSTVLLLFKLRFCCCSLVSCLCVRERGVGGRRGSRKREGETFLCFLCVCE